MEGLRKRFGGKSYLLHLDVSVPIVDELKVSFFAGIFLNSFGFNLNPFECPLSIGLPAVFFVNAAFEKEFAMNSHSVVFDDQTDQALLGIEPDVNVLIDGEDGGAQGAYLFFSVERTINRRSLDVRSFRIKPKLFVCVN